MKNGVIWIISLLVLIGYMFFWYLYVKAFDFSELFGRIDFISILLTPLIIGTVIGFLFALIPIKNRSYKVRLTLCIPLSVILVCLLFGWSFYRSGPRYDKISTEPGCNCKLYLNGTFDCEYLLIEREGNIQVQTNKRTNEKETFAVTWLSECEYQLQSANGIMKVKIVSGDQNGYDCYTTSGGLTSKRFRVNFKK